MLNIHRRVPEIFTDGGPENDNKWIDRLITSGYIIRTIQLDSRFSNSLVEALNRSLKVNCLYNHPLNTIADVTRLVNFYMDQQRYVAINSALLSSNQRTPMSEEPLSDNFVKTA